MYKNKNNGKIVEDVIYLKNRVYFVIDGIKESLPIEIFEANYEKINE